MEENGIRNQSLHIQSNHRKDYLKRLLIPKSLLFQALAPQPPHVIHKNLQLHRQNQMNQ